MESCVGEYEIFLDFDSSQPELKHSALSSQIWMDGRSLTLTLEKKKKPGQEGITGRKEGSRFPKEVGGGGNGHGQILKRAVPTLL